MSKRKVPDPSPEEDDEDDNRDSRGKAHQQEPQKVYDFHKKTIEVYPERLRELNRQFLSSLTTQITTEPYSVLVGNCLDYVRQYFAYEDDLLKYSPWLAARLKQSRSDIVNCLQDTIDVYEALARQDFDRLFEKNASGTAAPVQASTTSSSKTNSIVPLPIRPLPPPAPPTTSAAAATTSSFLPFTSFPAPVTTAATETAPSLSSNFKIPTSSSPVKAVNNTTPFTFSMPTSGFGTSTFSPPTFGSTSTAEKSSITAAPSFSFAAPSKLSFNPSTLPTGGDQAPATDENEDEPAEPPQPEKVDHEADAKLTYRCRMAVKKGEKLIKRGPVQVILKEANEKNQLIVRSDDTLGRLFLNILWSKMIEIKKNSSKDLTFVCKLNPVMSEIPEGEFVMILLRFDSETDRNDAHDKLEKERK